MEVHKKNKQVEATVEEVYIPPQANEEEEFNPDAYLSETEKQLQSVYNQLKESCGDEAPMLSQLESWKNRWGNIHVSKVGTDRKEYYVWRTLQRFEYKEMTKGGAHEDPDSFNEMIVEKCILFPLYDFSFRTKSDAGIITTLGQQIAYRSGFVSPQEALSLVFIA